MQPFLIIFDVDGTLAKAYTLDVLPGVREFFRLLYSGGCPSKPGIAIATNQGGVGMRRWLEMKGLGKPEKYPTQAEIEERLSRLLEVLKAPAGLPVYVSYRYQTRQGMWVPVPPEGEGQPRWEWSWRKPNPGMLLQAMHDAGVSPAQTLFVGDSPDDENAARAAGCTFCWAAAFFARDWESCAALEHLACELSENL